MRTVSVIITAALAWFGSVAEAQIVTTTPAPLQENSTGIVLTYHADASEGNKALAGLPESKYVYAHIGVLTNKSVTSGDWKYVVTPWPEADGSNATMANTDKNHMVYAGPNTYTLSIGSIRDYFGITDPSETVRAIAMVPRTTDGAKQGKTAAGGDIIIDVLSEGFEMTFKGSSVSNVFSSSKTVTFTAQTTKDADISITVNGQTVGSVSAARELVVKHPFSEVGAYEIVATATSNGQSISKTISYALVGDAVAGTYPGGVPRMGTVRQADGSVVFCLAAPEKNSAMLIGSWNGYKPAMSQAMQYQDYEGQRYFFTTVSGLEDNVDYPYYFVVDGRYNVGDPYAHLVLDYYSDKWIPSDVWPEMPAYPYELVPDNTILGVYRGDIDNYQWSPFTIPDHGNLIVYELLFRDWTGTEGENNGNGTVRQAIDKIPYLKSLGVNAVELMPIMEFNGNNSWGYNTNFYLAPDKAYGSPKDYKDFIDECHRNGIAVILDIVFNQSDGLHPWYKMYNISSNPFYNKTAPHAYSVLNDWNQGNPLVQQQWTDAVKYWMTAYNVDGFRFDLVKGLGDNDSYANGTENYNKSRVERMKRLYEVIKSVKPDGIHINEDLAGTYEEIKLGEAGMIQWSQLNGNSCQYAMGWPESSGDGLMLTSFYAPNNGKRPWGSTVAYAESHDEQRMGYKCVTWGNGSVKSSVNTMTKRLGSLAAIMLMTPGPKMIWQFGELGDQQNTKDANNGNDTSPKNVVWSYLDDPDRKALHDVYAGLCDLRTANPDLFGEQTEFTYTSTSNMSSPRYLRVCNGSKEAVAFINPNVTGGAVSVSVPVSVLSASNSRVVCASQDFEPVLARSGNNAVVEVPANSVAVFATNDVAAVDDVTVDGGDVTVSAVNGSIVVNGPHNAVSVYTLDGRQVPSTDLVPGLYIVSVDGRTHKVRI